MPIVTVTDSDKLSVCLSVCLLMHIGDDVKIKSFKAVVTTKHYRVGHWSSYYTTMSRP